MIYFSILYIASVNAGLQNGRYFGTNAQTGKHGPAWMSLHRNNFKQGDGFILDDI